MLALLRPWSAYYDCSSPSRNDNIDEDQVNYMLKELAEIEGRISCIYRRKVQFNLTEKYCQRALSHARQFEGEEELKTNILYRALRAYGDFRKFQGNFAEAVASAEENYNCLAVTYNPVHPKVQTAVGTLIQCLILKGDLYDAERFAQATLDSLKDPKNGLDQPSKAVADGYLNLSNVICSLNGDLVKAEMLARESLRILSHLYDHDHQTLAPSTGQLADILIQQGKLGCETKELLERSLAIGANHSGF